MGHPTIQVRPIAGALGAEIVGADLSTDLAETTVANIRAALLEHLVILFREQELTPAQQLAFAARFGKPVEYPFLAGIDGFVIVDKDRGCSVCPAIVEPVSSISVSRTGGDIVLDWSNDPAVGTRFAVYKLSGNGLGQGLLVGTTAERLFIHEGAATAPESYFYRITAIDACGGESEID